MRRDKSLGGIHKQLSVMLNIKFTLGGGRGLGRDICAHDRKSLDSQSRVTAAIALLLVLLATGMLND